MAGNTVYVQGNYVDVHDNEVVNLNIDKAIVQETLEGLPTTEQMKQADNDAKQQAQTQASSADADEPKRDEKLFRYIHYTVDSEHEWQIHDEVKRLVARQGIQMVCQCLKQMNDEKKLLLPPNNPTEVYAELVRMGMPQGKGFNESTFRKYYMTES